MTATRASLPTCARRLKRFSHRGACAAQPRVTTPRRALKACDADDRKSSRFALSPCPARRQATISVSSQSSRWAWLPPIRSSSATSGSRMPTARAWSPSANALTPRQRSIAARTWRKFAVGRARLHLRQSGLQGVAAGCGRGERVVDVGEMRTGLREESFRRRRRHLANAVPDRSCRPAKAATAVRRHP